ncbi:MAG: tetraacyldisaccharide 4'-kinase [Wenzhouxiangellaceae bacterium]
MSGWAQWLQRGWYAETPPAWPLRGLAGLYGALLPRRLPARQHDYPALIIVVGNIAVGGAGKTPLVIELCRYLRAQGYNPGVISRGYGGSARQVCVVHRDSDSALVGDEPLLIHRQTAAPVVVGRQRVAALQKLLEESSVDVVIADDGLQHDALPRDLELCLIDGRRALGNGWLLPAGPLRQPPERLATVDRVLYKQHQPAKLPLGDVLKLTLEETVHLQDEQQRPLSDWRGQHFTAIAGIADPESFFALLRTRGLEFDCIAYADHQRYSAREVAQLERRKPLLLTSKDAVKWPRAAAAGVWEARLRMELPLSFTEWLQQRLAHLVGERAGAGA